jgi:hypothetical protein
MALFTRLDRCSGPPNDRLLNLAPSYDGAHAARTRRVSAATLAPSSGQIATLIQSVGATTDSPVRIRYPLVMSSPGSAEHMVRGGRKTRVLVLRITQGGRKALMEAQQ